RSELAPTANGPSATRATRRPKHAAKPAQAVANRAKECVAKSGTEARAFAIRSPDRSGRRRPTGERAQGRISVRPGATGLAPIAPIARVGGVSAGRGVPKGVQRVHYAATLL